MSHLDAVARSIPEPVLPPNASNAQISGILRASRPFLDTDHDWILQNIEDFQQQISVYDALLDRTDEIRLETQRRRDVVQRSMATYSSTLAPIRRLPSEILCAVFREVQISLRSNPPESSFSLTEPTALDFSQAPWELSHVCGAWRDVILSYPQLWSRIFLQFGTCHPAEELRDTIPALQTMIHRSIQYPLDIVFEVGYSENEDTAIEAFSVILEESYRWRSIELNLSLPLLEQLKAAHGKIPCLESLTMEISYEAFDPPSIEELPQDVRNVFLDAPGLQKVTLHHACRPCDFIFPLHITHLATFMGNLSNIEAYQSLVECHLAIKEGRSPGVSPPHPIHLPNVRCLFVSSLDLLPWLRLPLLDDLTISNGPNFESNMDVVVLMMNEFVYRSRCTLTRLAIHSPVSHNHLFINDCLLLMDSLVSLEIGLWNWEVKFLFDALASIRFLPNLQHLLLRIPYTHPLLLNPLVAMISSRSQYLRSIKISCGRADDMERVKERLVPLRPPELSAVVQLESQREYEMICCFGKFGSA
ncbi:hypothetical protein EDD85DRAFT_951889 [Armillaria nabsnona]|nr:hypothetical protein EDD85DRAFT_951889 [Armillaria nabsnona]